MRKKNKKQESCQEMFANQKVDGEKVTDNRHYKVEI